MADIDKPAFVVKHMVRVFVYVRWDCCSLLMIRIKLLDMFAKYPEFLRISGYDYTYLILWGWNIFAFILAYLLHFK